MCRSTNLRGCAWRRALPGDRRVCFRLCFVAASTAIARGEVNREAFAARARESTPRSCPERARPRRPRGIGVARTHLSEHHLHPPRGLFRSAPLRPHRRGARGGPSRGGTARGGGSEQRAPDGVARLESRPTRHPIRIANTRAAVWKRAEPRARGAPRFSSARSASIAIDCPLALFDVEKTFRMGN